MDPWVKQNQSVTDNSQAPANIFEDNFNPSVNNRLPDSELYLKTLENKLEKLRSNPSILRQLAEKREACMQELMQSGHTYDTNSWEFEAPIPPSSICKFVAPERQALTVGEVKELVKYDLLESSDQDDLSDRISR